MTLVHAQRIMTNRIMTNSPTPVTIQRGPLVYKHISRISYLCKQWSKAGSPLGRSFLLSAGGLSRGVLPFHYHRHCTHVSFTAVLSMDVLQHCLSG
jgi:hypothetical protein